MVLADGCVWECTNTMACDHLNVELEILGWGSEVIQLYAPTTVGVMRAAIAKEYSVGCDEVGLELDGYTATDRTRVVDQSRFVVRLPTGARRVDKADHMYFAFGLCGVVYLVDMARGVVIEPSPVNRLGRCLVYADWSKLLDGVAVVSPLIWLYDVLRRGFGVLGTSTVFGAVMAPFTEYKRYHQVCIAWLDQVACGVRRPVACEMSGMSVTSEPLEGDEDGTDVTDVADVDEELYWCQEA